MDSNKIDFKILRPQIIYSRAVLEIPTGPPVRGQQLWRRTRNFLLIFLQFYVYDLQFKVWGPPTFFTEFQMLLQGVYLPLLWYLSLRQSPCSTPPCCQSDCKAGQNWGSPEEELHLLTSLSIFHRSAIHWIESVYLIDPVFIRSNWW